jgi:DNA polymerase-3 subunit beta
MKLICDGMDLADAVSVVGRAASARVMNPILEGIKLTAKNGTLTLAATDLEIYLQKTIRADVDAEGVCVVPGRLFGEYVGKLGKSSVGLTLEGENLKITHDDNVANLQCLLLVEYPDTLSSSKKPHFSIKSEQLRDFIAKTRVSVSADDSRPILKGVLLEIGKDKVVGVALDGFRLSRVEKPIENHAAETKVVVPGRSLDEIKKLIADDNGEVSIIIDNKFFQVNVNKTVFAGRLIDGEFINYHQIIPSKFESNAIVERAAFEQAVERARLLVRSDKVNLVTLNFTDKAISITSNNEYGRISEKVKTALTGKDMKIAFNAAYLSDVTRATTDEFLKINFSTELSPVVVTSAKAADFLFLVLPVRIG